MRRVVAGVEQQPGEQLTHGVLPARAEPGLAALDRLILRGAGDHGVRVQGPHGDEGGEHLERRGGAVPGVRGARGEHGAGVEIGEHPRCGIRDRPAARADLAARTHPRPTHRLGRPGQRGRYRPCLLVGGRAGRGLLIRTADRHARHRRRLRNREGRPRQCEHQRHRRDPPHVVNSRSVPDVRTPREPDDQRNGGRLNRHAPESTIRSRPAVDHVNSAEPRLGSPSCRAGSEQESLPCGSVEVSCWQPPC
jgi:hypothetical protein